MPELKPCPFCGSKARVYKIKLRSEPEEKAMYKVECIVEKWCSVIPGTFPYKTEQEAVAAWNRRAGKEDV